MPPLHVSMAGRQHLCHHPRQSRRVGKVGEPVTGWQSRFTVNQRLLAIIAVALLPALTALLYINVGIYQSRLNETHALAFRTGELASLEMKRIVTGVESTLFALARVPVVREFATPDCSRYLSDVASDLPEFRAILAIDVTGQARCSSSARPGEEGTQAQPVFSEALESGRFTVGTFTRPANEPTDPFLPLVLPIYRGQQIVGLVAAELDLGWLGEQIRSREFPEGGALTIADRDGVILAREPLPDRFVGLRIPDEFQNLVHADAPGTRSVMSQDGTRRVIGYFPPAVTGTGLYISSGVSTEAALTFARASAYRSFLLAAIGTALAFMVAWVAGSRLFRVPIRRLVQTVEAWRRGDDAARTGIVTDASELSILAHAIDTYMNELVADRTARRAAEESRDLLLREMEHRVKNLLAMVQAVVRQTLKGEVAPQVLIDIQERLSAMAEAQRTLLSGAGQSADLRDVVTGTLAPFGVREGDRLSLAGPTLRLTPQATLALTMVLHELGTNAVKYGALADLNGSVEIRWQLTHTTSPLFRFEWLEHGGPPVVAPEKSGFGTRLVQAALSSEFNAKVSLTYPPTGAAMSFEVEAERFLNLAIEQAA